MVDRPRNILPSPEFGMDKVLEGSVLIFWRYQISLEYSGNLYAKTSSLGSAILIQYWLVTETKIDTGTQLVPH